MKNKKYAATKLLEQQLAYLKGSIFLSTCDVIKFIHAHSLKEAMEKTYHAVLVKQDSGIG